MWNQVKKKKKHFRIKLQNRKKILFNFFSWMKSREIWKKTTQKFLQIFFWEKFKEIFFHVFPDENISGEWTDYFFFFLFKELRRHYIFMCETKWKKNNPYSFLGFFSGKHFRRIFYHLEKMCWKSFHIFPCETELKKKKSVSLFGRKLMGEFYYAELFLEKEKKNSPRFILPCKSKWKTGFLEIF